MVGERVLDRMMKQRDLPDGAVFGGGVPGANTLNRRGGGSVLNQNTCSARRRKNVLAEKGRLSRGPLGAQRTYSVQSRRLR